MSVSTLTRQADPARELAARMALPIRLARWLAISRYYTSRRSGRRALVGLGEAYWQDEPINNAVVIERLHRMGFPEQAEDPPTVRRIRRFLETRPTFDDWREAGDLPRYTCEQLWGPS